MPADVLVNAPDPLVITDEMRVVARTAPGRWLFVVDPHLEPVATVPHHGLIGAWRIGDDGEIGTEFRRNPGYRPSPLARGWPAPSDALDRTAQLAATGYATLDDVAVALLYDEVSYLAGPDDAPLLDADGLVVAFSAPPSDSGSLPAGTSWQRSSGRALTARVPQGADVVVNPGRWEALLPAAELAARAAGEASGEALVARIEQFLAGDLDPHALHEAFCAAQVFCQAGERPGFRAVEDDGDRAVPVFTSLVELARFAGQTPWFSTVGQDVLDLLPDGYDIVVDPGWAHPLRLLGSATELRERAPEPPGEGRADATG
jgi:hypothetical protein